MNVAPGNQTAELNLAVMPIVPANTSEEAGFSSGYGPSYAATPVRPMRHGVALVVSASLLAAGCTVAPSEQTPATTAAVPTTEKAEDQCAPPGIKAFRSDQFLCQSRRVGELLVVIAPGLSNRPTIDLTNPAGDVTQVAKYATDGLRTVTGGTIDLKPRVVQAPAAAIEAIKQENPDGCIQLEPAAKRMSTIVASLLPAEVEKAAQTIVVGGRSCGDQEGNISGVARSDIGGVADPATHTADVYSESYPGFHFNPATPITTLGGITMHELLHNFGFGHSGTLTFADFKAVQTLEADPTQSIDIATLLNQKVNYHPTGDIGNIASNAICNIIPEDDCQDVWLNPKQRDFLLHNAHPYNTDLPHEAALLLPKTKVDIPDGAKAGNVRAVEIPIPGDFADTGYVALGNEPLTKIILTPYETTANRTAGIELLLATGTTQGRPMTTVHVGSFAISGTPRLLSVGRNKVSISRQGTETLFEFTS